MPDPCSIRILRDEDKPLLHRNCKVSPEAFLKAVEPYQAPFALASPATYLLLYPKSYRIISGRAPLQGRRQPHGHRVY
jgi:hypothetical protein